MSNRMIPEHIDPFRAAEQKLTESGIVKLADLHRLTPLLSLTDGIATVELQFGLDDEGISTLKGHVEAKLPLQCQRCMEPMVYEIISDFLVGIVNTIDEIHALPSSYEPALAKEGSLALRELIEDEMILNLPIIPRHEPDVCKVKLPLTDSSWEQGKGDNPFRILESLKHKQDK